MANRSSPARKINNSLPAAGPEAAPAATALVSAEGRAPRWPAVTTPCLGRRRPNRVPFA